MSRPLNGILPVDKPEGPTSHDVVAIARRAVGMRRIGHTGTLDPFASGLLLLCLDRATRLAEYLAPLPKTYHARARLGVATETDDREGAILAVREFANVTREMVKAALSAQVGVRLQLPPRYSAKKVAGERMYARARKGLDVPVSPVEVNIYRAEVIAFVPPDVEFEIECSSGTYIRAIARDLGNDLGVGAHLVELRRTRIGHFEVDAALPIGELTDEEAVARCLVTPADSLKHLPKVELSEPQVNVIGHGGAVEVMVAAPAGQLALVNTAGELVAVGTAEGLRIRPLKVFA